MFKLEKRILFDSALPVEIIDLISQGGDIAGGANNLAASADGQFVVFDSAADNLVLNDTNGMRDVFLYDSVNGTISAITQGNAASANADISADGNIIVFESSATDLGPTGGQKEIFQYNKTSGTMTMITDGNGDSTNPAVSADGTKIAFESFATDVTTNVVVDKNSAKDVFLYNGTTINMISINKDGTDSGNGTSSNADVANNGYVAFQSTANNLVAGDNDGGVDIYFYNGTNSLLNGFEGRNASITADGELIAYSAKSIFDGTVHDIQLYDTTTLNYTNITNGNISSTLPSITSGGEYISFQSQASNLVTGGNTNSDIYSYKIDGGTFDLKSESTGIYSDSAVSANGEKVFFISNGKHHDIDTNGANDLFIDHFRIVASEPEPEPEPEPEEIVVVTEPSDSTITISDSGNSSGDKFDMDDDLERAVSNISTVISAENQDVNYFDKHNMATAFNIVNGEYAINFSNFVAGTDGNTDDIAIKKHKNLESAFINQNEELKNFFSDLGDEEEDEDE